MNQPTREEFEQLKAQVKRLEEQATEPIKITDTILLQTLVTMAGNQATDVALLKGDMQVVKGDISTLKMKAERLETKVDDGFLAMEKRFDAIAEVQRLILERLPEKDQ
jgi:phage shock protein A